MKKYCEKDVLGWNAFVEECKKRVSDDNKELGIKSEYVPHAIICTKPDYCLVTMEPGKAPSGYKAFGDWHINYCAYHYLCNGEFKYHVTDLAKGAINTKIADKTRKERYKKWVLLLKKELKLLGNPKAIIVNSIKAEEEIKKHKLKEVKVFRITNGSLKWKRNRDKILKKYDDIKKKDKKCDVCIPTEEEWRKFIEGLMKRCEWGPELIEARNNGKKGCPQISEEFNNDIKKKFFVIYKYELEEIKKEINTKNNIF